MSSNQSKKPQSRKRKNLCSVACTKCHTSHTKCDGVFPCSRCNRLGVECVPFKQKKRGFAKGTHSRKKQMTVKKEFVEVERVATPLAEMPPPSQIPVQDLSQADLEPSLAGIRSGMAAMNNPYWYVTLQPAEVGLGPEGAEMVPRIVEITPQMATLHGFTDAELIGQPGWKLCPLFSAMVPQLESLFGNLIRIVAEIDPNFEVLEKGVHQHCITYGGQRWLCTSQKRAIFLGQYRLLLHTISEMELWPDDRNFAVATYLGPDLTQPAFSITDDLTLSFNWPLMREAFGAQLTQDHEQRISSLLEDYDSTATFSPSESIDELFLSDPIIDFTIDNSIAPGALDVNALYQLEIL